MISSFGRILVKIGRVSKEFQRYLLQGQELRHIGDYVEPRGVSRQQAEEAVRQARQFLDLAQEMIGSLHESG